MKKILYFLLVAILVFSLAACSSEQDVESDNDEPKQEEVEKNTEKETEKKEPEQTEEEKEWGVTQGKTCEKNGNTQWVYVNFTELLGISKGTGRCAYQPDGTLCFLDSETDSTEEVVDPRSVDNIFPAYSPKAEFIVESYLGAGYKDVALVIDKKENVTINDYEMCKITGKFTFKKKGTNEEFSWKCIIYATQTKANGAFVYWAIADMTEDQSNGKLIETNSLKMAKSFYEK